MIEVARVYILKTIPAAAAAFVFVTLPAAADQATEDFLKSWVTSIDASPDFTATFASVQTGADGATTLSGLSIKSEQPGFAADVETIAVTGFDPGANALFAADTVTIDGAAFTAAFATVKLADATLTGFSLPNDAAFAWDNAQPYLSFIKVVKAFAGVSMASARVGALALDQNYEGERSTTTYQNVALDNWDGGRIASISAGPVKAESPSGETLVAMSIASAETRDLDLGALLTVLDPDQYAGGKGDMVWHPVIGHTGYSDLLMAIPGVTIRMAAATNDEFRMRQPENGIAPLLDIGKPGMEDIYEDNPEKAAELAQVLTAFGIGKIALTGIGVEASGVERLAIAGITLSDISSDKFGEFAVDGVDVAIEGQGAVKVGRFAFGDLVFPPLEAILAAAQAEDTGEDVDVSSVLPQLGFLEASAVDVALTGMPSGSLENLRVDLRNYVGPVPTDVSYDLANIDIPVSLIEEEQAREMLTALGYERVQIDSGLKATWTDSTINVGEYRVGIRDFGSLNGSAVLVGLLPSEYEMLQEPEVLAKLSFVEGALTVTDDSIVGRGLAMQAAQLNANPDEFREQFAMGLPFMLTFLGDTELQQQIAPILQTFIRTTGGSVTATAKPSAPVPLIALATASESAPFTLLKLLNVAFSGVPGEEPAATPAATPDAAPAAPAEPEPPKMPDADKPSKSGDMRSTLPSDEESEQ